MDQDSTTYKVLSVLIETEDMLTPSQIGDVLDMRRQKVRYHLNTLRDMGLIIKDDDVYYCQPAFIEDEFQDECFKKIDSLIPELLDEIYIEQDDTEGKRTVVMNCLKIELLKVLRDYF